MFSEKNMFTFGQIAAMRQKSESFSPTAPQDEVVEGLLDAIDAPAALVDPEGRVVGANHGWIAGRGDPNARVVPETLAEEAEVRVLSASRRLVVLRTQVARGLEESSTEDEVLEATTQEAVREGACAAVVVRGGVPQGIVSASGAAAAEALALLRRCTSLESVGPLSFGHSAPLPVRVRWLWRGRAPEVVLLTWATHPARERIERLERRACAHLTRLRLTARLERVAADLSDRAAALRQMVENLTEAVWLVDRAGTVLLCNQTANDLAGGNLSSLRELTRLAPESASFLDEVLHSTEKGGSGPRSAVLRLATPAGVRRVELSITALDGEGDAGGWVASARDVTAEHARRRALEGLVRVAEGTIRPLDPGTMGQALVRSVRQAFRVDAVGLWLRPLPGGPGHRGVPEPVAHTGAGARHLVNHPGFARSLEEEEPLTAREGGNLFVYAPLRLRGRRAGVLGFTCRAGSEAAEQLGASPGTVSVLARMVAQALDLASSRREADEARRTLDAALHTLPDALVVTDHRGRIRHANEAARHLSRPEGRQGETLEDLLARADARDMEGEVLGDLADRISRGEKVEVSGTIRAEGPEGAEDRRAVVLTALPLSRAPGDDHGGSLLVIHDVTRERELERMKDTFLNGAAHELRTPLATLKTHAQHSLRRLDRGVDEERIRQALQVMERQADRMSVLVNDLLDVSRLTLGKMRLRQVSLELGRTVTEACVPLRAHARQHELVLEIPQPVWVEGDPDRLEQVVSALVGNAIRFSPLGGRIEVRVGVQEGRALVEVSDQGTGIAPEHLPHIFDRFYRATDDPRVAPGGLGLGLWMARRLVQLHGGRIDVESVPGVGSTFRVTLGRVVPEADRPQAPALQEGSARACEKASESPPSAGKRISG